MGTFYALNTGKSDCFVLRLEDGNEMRTVVIDGGTRHDPRLPLHEFLPKLGCKQVDLLIMTHLHQDHLGFLPEVTERFPVASAVLPYPLIPVDPDRASLVLREKQVPIIRRYNDMWCRLSGNTDLYTTYPMTAPDFVFGGYEISCCAPAPGAVSAVWKSYETAYRIPDDQLAHEILETERGAVNGESSVWLLSLNGKPLAVICGDCLDETLAEVVERRGLGRVPIVKLSHHGRNEKLVYFTSETIGGLQPDILLVSADEKVRDKYLDDWKTLAPQARIMVTCDADGAFRIPLQ